MDGNRIYDLHGKDSIDRSHKIRVVAMARGMRYTDNGIYLLDSNPAEESPPRQLRGRTPPTGNGHYPVRPYGNYYGGLAIFSASLSSFSPINRIFAAVSTR